MRFSFFNRKNKQIENEQPRPYLTKELIWDDEKIIANRFNGTQRIMYYKNIIRVDIIFDDFYLPIPKWILQDDNLEDTTGIDFYNDLQPTLTDLVVDMFSKKLEGYDNEKVHHTIVEAMGASMGLFHLWGRDDLNQVLKHIREANKPRINSEIDRFIEENQQRKANRWWKNIF
ncbi:hypothetical protein GWP85_13000 [Acinetobacter beijerinckii]|uniref:hypothetical protein n=1 Tax=Acinetobacter beijerinckii TaxID=262668 RepID=UPI0023DD8535|nr:hypothetical protein [Acinetobacter beijerinckii]MDF2418414.1 hypothetical protein [Acinetobacter beijerinckii]